jgi:phosphoadenylyl-sulfate reductase (thioredoxin)
MAFQRQHSGIAARQQVAARHGTDYPSRSSQENRASKDSSGTACIICTNGKGRGGYIIFPPPSLASTRRYVIILVMYHYSSGAGMSPTAEPLTASSRSLGGQTPQEILRWAVTQFHPRLTMATAFGAEGCCLIHMLAEIEPSVRIFNLDTGYQFPETLELRERIKTRYGIAVEMIQPEMTVAEYEAEHGGPLYTHRPDQCCHDRKILPLRRAVVGYEAWISAIRRDQTEQRRGRHRTGTPSSTGQDQPAAIIQQTWRSCEE